MLLFVYGTLRRGGDNHAKLAGARYISSARTVAGYELVDMGGYPAVLEHGCDAIVGELYEIDDALSKRLDAFEEVPTLYERKRVRLDPMCQETRRDRMFPFADAYIMKREHAGEAPRLEGGDWLSVAEFSADTVGRPTLPEPPNAQS